MSLRCSRQAVFSVFRAAALGVAALCLSVSYSATTYAQIGGGGGQQGGGGGTGNTIGGGNTSGVAVDADGVLRRLTVGDFTGQLEHQRAQQARTLLDSEVVRPSQLRKVSLTRLARLTRKAIDEGHGPDDTMKHLAGLTRIQYVFYYPDTQDIVLAGPAEGWMESESGRMVGLESGRPVVELQDLVVALRTFPPSGTKNPFVYCSIDPTQEGLSRMQQFLSRIGRQIQPGDTQMIVHGLRESLGLQKISIGGVAPSTHMAQVMVEADYRMKLIGIGLEQPPVRIASFVSLANPASVAKNALQRWYFVPDYQRIRVTEDGFAAEFVGAGVKLVGEDELVTKNGQRQSGRRQSRASRKFTQSFSSRYNQLADRAPVYAQLRNCIDLLVAAAMIQKNDLYGLADWDLAVLGDESIYPVETYNAPQEVATAVSSMWKGNRLMTPVGGGVEVRASLALDAANLLADDKGAVKSARESLDLSQLPADVWWWD